MATEYPMIRADFYKAAEDVQYFKQKFETANHQLVRLVNERFGKVSVKALKFYARERSGSGQHGYLLMIENERPYFERVTVNEESIWVYWEEDFYDGRESIVYSFSVPHEFMWDSREILKIEDFENYLRRSKEQRLEREAEESEAADRHLYEQLKRRFEPELETADVGC